MFITTSLDDRRRLTIAAIKVLADIYGALTEEMIQYAISSNTIDVMPGDRDALEKLVYAQLRLPAPRR